MRSILVCILLSIFLLQCQGELGLQSESSAGNLTGKDRYLVLNEGLFNWSNASIGTMDASIDAYNSRRFFNSNATPIGDILQDASQRDSLWAFSVNNSDKVVITNNAFEEQMLFEVPQPRHLLWLDDLTILVSSLSSTGVYKIDIQDRSVSPFAQQTGWGEHLFFYDNRIGVVFQHFGTINSPENRFAVYDRNMNLLSELTIHTGIRDAVETNDHIAILTTSVESDSSRILLIDKVAPFVHEEYTLPESLLYLAYDKSAGALFLAGESLYVWNKDSGLQFIKTLREATIYGMDIAGPWISVCNAGDYVSNGTVDFYSKNGEFFKRVSVGKIPNQVIEIK